MPLLASNWRERWVDFRKARMVTYEILDDREFRFRLESYIVRGEQNLG
jgi:hypothetical protein